MASRNVALKHQDLVAWARDKFGALIDQYAPTADELLAIQSYYAAHPGAPTAQFVDLLARQRSSHAPGNPAPGEVIQGPRAVAPGTPGQAGWDLTLDTAPTTPTTHTTSTPSAAKAESNATGMFAPGLPADAYDKTGQADATWLAKHGNAPVVKAWIEKNITGPSGQSSSAVLDQFKGDTPVYIVGPATSQIPTPGGQHKVNPTGGITSSTYQEVLTNFYKMTPEEIRALKQQLWDGGFYPSGTDKSVIDSSTPDVATRNAYTIAVQQAARLAEAGHQTTVEDVIAGGNPDPEKSTGAAALGPYTITNPADLKEALNSAAQERLGRNLSKDEIATFASLYQGMESQSSLRYQAAGRNNQQTGILAPASPTAAAQDYLDTHFANQEQGYGAVQRQQAFFSMLGPITGG